MVVGIFTIVNIVAKSPDGDIVLTDAEFELHSSKLDRLPLSVKLVIEVLEPGSRLTQKNIMNRTSLSARTVRWALTRLKEENLLITKSYFRRQILYSLKPHPLGVKTARVRGELDEPIGI